MAEHETNDSAGASERPAKIIKRYTNRKLYDTVESRYVTLDEIAEMVKAGTEVQIIDNRTKEDLTSVTMAQIIFEEEKKTSKMPLPMLREIIRTGGSKLQAFISDELTPRVTAFRTEAEHAMARVLRREEHEAAASADGKKPNSLEQAQEFIRSSRQGIEEWQRSLDERLHRAVETVAGLPTLHREVQALRDKLAELEKKLEEHK
ncbi:polyhydroxyalkanoate synthesis regulator DNA-binding domain-containing protein [Vulgatibacter sp.]|uniref:polyhydroxyalkanoate synthesis regulator DNA-binding domain-containing protein n=1 Tax=Vulgatibacter sp. TaxID=1971226 RepID=UPI00356A29C5